MKVFLKQCCTLLPLLIGLVIGLAWPSLVSAQAYTREQYLAMIETYVDKVRNIYDGSWAYSYTSNNLLEERSLTRRIDPSLPFLLSEQIILENGGPPAAETLERHERRMQRRLRRREGKGSPDLVEEEEEREGNEKERFLALLIPDSLELVSVDGDLHTLEFRGMEEDRRTIYEHLKGTLVLDTRNEYIQELQIRVLEPFSPYLIMHINDGYFSLRFELRDGVPVQTEGTWKLDGHLLFVKDLDRDMELKWFDVERVGTENTGLTAVSVTGPAGNL